jgi:hypothetical protein
MVFPLPTPEVVPPDEVSLVSSLQIYQRQPTVNPCDRRALICDFFSWFEYEWQQPVIRTTIPLSSNVFRLSPELREMLDEQKMYTSSDLSLLFGHTHAKIKVDLKTHHIHAEIDPLPRGVIARARICTLGTISSLLSKSGTGTSFAKSSTRSGCVSSRSHAARATTA